MRFYMTITIDGRKYYIKRLYCEHLKIKKIYLTRNFYNKATYDYEQKYIFQHEMARIVELIHKPVEYIVLG